MQFRIRIKLLGNWVTLFFLSFLIFACNNGSSKEEETDETPNFQLFDLKRPSQTGLDFKTKGQILHPMDNTGLLSGGSGIAVGDINNDGLQDLFFSGGLNNSALFLNEGNLKFKDITQSAGIIDAGPSIARTEGVNMVDVNGDGYLDIYVLKSGLDGNFNTGQFNKYGANMLFINQGNNTFIEESAKYGLDLIGLSQTASFFDYDADGDLDVYVVQTPEPGAAFSFPYYNAKPAFRWLNDQFLENNGFRFFDAREKAGLLFERNVGLSISVADVNNDGHSDIYIANDFFGRDFFYVNNGDKTFSEQHANYFTKTPMSAMGSDFGDINNDGWLDLFVGEMMPETHRRQKLNLVPFSLEIYNKLLAEKKPQYTRNMLQLNKNGSHFRDIGLLAGVHATEWSWASFFFDADNDGHQDLFVANGIRRDMTNMDFIKSNYGENYTDMADPQAMSKVNPDEAPVIKTPNYMYRNLGNYTFKKMNSEWGINQPVHTRGGSYADLDNDGDLDLILNNMEEGPFLYQNKAENLADYHFLRIKLQARGKNTFGIGAKVQVYQQNRIQTNYLSTQRGFQSSPEPILHFGLGKDAVVDSLVIIWPGGQREIIEHITADQVLLIKQGENKSLASSVGNDSQSIFREKENMLSIPHQERTFLDYRMERLLVRQYSKEGPGLAIADVNGDGLDDCFIGGAAGSDGMLYFQQQNGTLLQSADQGWMKEINITEDMGAIFFDANADGAMDLYLASGSNEFNADAPALEDQLYYNDGSGRFIRNNDALPPISGYSSIVVAADYDQDGDQDLFVGGRTIPGNYSEIPVSRLLQNNEGNFRDVTEEVAPDLVKAGRITSALWTDPDNDGDFDLMLVGEWMPLTIFYNNGNKLSPKTIDNTEGWWNSLTGADVDNDGDIDYIAGNHGLNSIFKANAKEPITLLIGDFDNNGKQDPVVFKYTSGINAPFVNRDIFTSQMPYFNNRFYSFENYADAQMGNLFEEQQLKKAQANYVYELRSTVFLNDNGKLTPIPLPIEAQMAPVYGMNSQDFNEDGFLDLILVGNSYSTHYEYGSIDGLGGLLLYGDGSGKFRAVDQKESGLNIPNDAKSLGWMRHASGKPWLVIGNNNSGHQIFEWEANLEFIPVPSNASHVIIELKDGNKRKEEFYLGGGYLSQSSRYVIKNASVERVQFFDGEDELE